MTELRYVGQPYRRADGHGKVTGTVRYISDLSVPGMVVGQVLRLPYAHARILSIDTSAAREIPGVLAVLTAEDLGAPVPMFGSMVYDQPVLAHGRIRFQGEPVAAVAAVDAAAAAAALEAIVVDCEELPAASSIDEALAPDAPLVVDADARPASDPWRATNVMHEFQYGWGEPEATSGATRVFEHAYNFPPIHHYAVEPHGCIASWDGAGLTLWSATQNPFLIRRAMADTFQLPMSRVRVIVPTIGGGFGGKGYPKYEPIAAALSRAAGRPVKLMCSAEDSFRTTRRAGARVVVRTGVGDDGSIRFQDVQADFLVGAYMDISLRVVGKASLHACGPYMIPNVRINSRAVASHTTPSSAFRGFGAPQFGWAIESQMDEVARELGIDPLEFRLRHLPKPGEMLVPDEAPVDGDWAEGLRRVAAAIGWDQPRPPGRGRGLAIGMKSSMPSTTSVATVHMHGDGSVTVQVGTAEVGQGSRTAFAQIAAECLGVPVERVAVPDADTSLVPYDFRTASSRSTALVGNAVVAACTDLLRRLADLGAELLGGAAEVDTAAGVVRGPAGALAYREVFTQLFGPGEGDVVGQGMFRGPRDPKNPLGGPAAFWEVCFNASEVEVDPGTGQVHVVRHVVVSDVGRAINPAQAEQQDLGAAMMGIGHTLFEEMHYQSGQLLNPNLVDYRVPFSTDLPEEFTSSLVENADGPGPFGAKGIGEGGIIAVAPSVGNALYEAAGVRIRSLPLTPERVWGAIHRRCSQ